MIIETKKRAEDDWIAYAQSDNKRWECGRTEVEAIGKLMVSLAAKRERSKRVNRYHFTLVFWRK